MSCNQVHKWGGSEVLDVSNAIMEEWMGRVWKSTVVSFAIHFCQGNGGERLKPLELSYYLHSHLRSCKEQSS